MTGAEQRIFENLKAGEEIPPAQRTSFCLRDTTKYVEFQLSPPLASIKPSTSNKRSTADTEPDITILKNRGRKPGTVNKEYVN
ncbi:hypothetical protein BpHYR1_005443 [Brachionus plicatilis]|uniref:Uncharacterized protein n=1 Tax=Brachionus plicatilis TaxID=10195 RepID=A0A3M7Q3S7_BRAPC|nr:hypothetical protein BpHYR1_005443 [Brachionus plicatilis]